MNKVEATAELTRLFDVAINKLVTDGEVSPIFIVLTGEGETLLMPSSWGSREAKRKAFSVASMLCVHHDAQSLVTITEAWMVRCAEGERLEVQPADSDRRIEVVSAHMSYRDNGAVRHLSMVSEIERSDDGKARGVVQPVTALECLGGEVAAIFPQYEPSPAMRAMAAAVVGGLTIEVDDPS